MEYLFSTVIPIILLIGIVGYNMMKMKKRAKKMKEECGNGCEGCSYSAGCNKKTDNTK